MQKPSNLHEDPLGQPIAGIVLRCGGNPPRRGFARFSLKPPGCRESTVVAFLGDWDAVRLRLEAEGWSLALGSRRDDAAILVGKAEVHDDGKLYVPGQAVLDPLCPSCTKDLMDRMSSGTA